MKFEILSLNIGGPAEMKWNDKSVVSSMHKKPVADGLVVSRNDIRGDSFANPKAHGLEESVLYVFGMTSIQRYLDRLQHKAPYEFGELGENVTLNDFDETQVSVGDTFRFGDVIAEATWPRIPCSKLNIRMKHPDGQRLMIESGVSGVYFRILTPGRIRMGDQVERVSVSENRFAIADLYEMVCSGQLPSPAQFALAVENGAFPQRQIDKWKARLEGKA